MTRFEFPNRQAVEREIESAENPKGMRLNDGKERVTLPGGTLRYMLAVMDKLNAEKEAAYAAGQRAERKPATFSVGPTGFMLVDATVGTPERAYEEGWNDALKADRERMEAMPSLYDRTGDIKDLNLRVVPLTAIRNRKDQA